MIIKLDHEKVILDEDINLCDINAHAEAMATVIINGNTITVKEFREMRHKDPQKGKFGRKAMNEMDNKLI